MIGGLDNPVATGGTALVAAVVIQAVKNSGWATWFNRNTPYANLFLSFVTALVSAQAIHLTYDGASGLGSVAFSTHAIWTVIVQWSTQHGMYKGLVVPSETLGEIRALLQRALQPPISQPEAKSEGAPVAPSTVVNSIHIK